MRRKEEEERNFHVAHFEWHGKSILSLLSELNETTEKCLHEQLPVKNCYVRTFPPFSCLSTSTRFMERRQCGNEQWDKKVPFFCSIMKNFLSISSSLTVVVCFFCCRCCCWCHCCFVPCRVFFCSLNCTNFPSHLTFIL